LAITYLYVIPVITPTAKTAPPINIIKNLAGIDTYRYSDCFSAIKYATFPPTKKVLNSCPNNYACKFTMALI